MATVATSSSLSSNGHGHDSASSLPSYSHAVCRSSELLSCAKTALKIAKAQHANDDNDNQNGTTWWSCQDVNSLSLHVWKQENNNNHDSQFPQFQSQLSQLNGLCEEGLSLLRTMELELQQLERLVRRRGHVNDPTQEIAASVQRLESDAKSLSVLVKTGFLFPRATTHYQRHAGWIATWLETVATLQMNRLKEILKVRGTVLADQAQRRKLLQPSTQVSTTSNATAMMPQPTRLLVEPPKQPALAVVMPPPLAMDTPLFHMTPLPKPSVTSTGSNGKKLENGHGPQPATTVGGGYGGYGGTSTAGGYGTTTSTSAYGGLATAASGIRHRRGGKASSSTTSNYYQQQQNQQEQEDEVGKVHSQIQLRKQKRQTQSRLEEAQQAERTLAELGTMFSKMSSLISQQGEVLEKVEDDVEAGLVEVTAGQEEITILYSIKKGNRGLIIKVFALLIFFIIFMRFYKR